YEDCGITGPARYCASRYLASRNFAGRVNYFCDAITVATAAEIVNRAALFKNIELEHMRVRQIDYVNVVANARAIARGIVVTNNLNVGPRASRRVQHQRNQMCFRIVPFAESFAGSGGIEVTKTRIT